MRRIADAVLGLRHNPNHGHCDNDALHVLRWAGGRVNAFREWRASRRDDYLEEPDYDAYYEAYCKDDDEDDEDDGDDQELRSARGEAVAIAAVAVGGMMRDWLKKRA